MKGMKRVALCPQLPNVFGKSRIMLDVGANTDIRPEHIFDDAENIYIADTENYRILKSLGIPTIQVKGCTDSALLLEDIHLNASRNIPC